MPLSFLRLTALLCLLGFGLILSLPADVSATCSGTRYDYYETSAYIHIVGTKVSCPGYPDQWDDRTVTPWSTTQVVGCPCPPSSGGIGGGENTDDDEEN